jgi:HPr kinase/phosphorylase
VNSPLKQHITETAHGVFMRINHVGVFIIGVAGSGKSSLALALLHQGHQLIADDCVEFQQQGEHIIGICPPLLKGMLHQREIGLIDVAMLFGKTAVRSHAPLDLVLQLDPMHRPAATLQPMPKYTTLLGQQLPLLTLNPNNPAQLSYRLTSWLAMQNQHTADHFCQQQANLLQRQQAS